MIKHNFHSGLTGYVPSAKMIALELDYNDSKRTVMAAHADMYHSTRRVTFRQRLCLVLGAKQNHRRSQVW